MPRSAPILAPPHRGKAGRPPTPVARIGLTRNVRRCIELMVFGAEDGLPLTRKEAAAIVGIRDDSLRIAFRNPDVMKHYNEQLQVLRESARPRAFAQIAELSEGAKAEGVRLKAAQYIDSNGRAGGDQVNVNVGVAVQLPGYRIAIDPAYAQAIEATAEDVSDG